MKSPRRAHAAFTSWAGLRLLARSLLWVVSASRASVQLTPLPFDSVGTGIVSRRDENRQAGVISPGFGRLVSRAGLEFVAVTERLDGELQVLLGLLLGLGDFF